MWSFSDGVHFSITFSKSAATLRVCIEHKGLVWSISFCMYCWWVCKTQHHRLSVRLGQLRWVFWIMIISNSDAYSQQCRSEDSEIIWEVFGFSLACESSFDQVTITKVSNPGSSDLLIQEMAATISVLDILNLFSIFMFLTNSILASEDKIQKMDFTTEKTPHAFVLR